MLTEHKDQSSPVFQTAGQCREALSGADDIFIVENSAEMVKLYCVGTFSAIAEH